MGKHLKLGTYSFVVNADELGLSDTPKSFTREQLPDELKSLFDIISKNELCEKSIFMHVKSDADVTYYCGYLVQRSKGIYSLVTPDGIGLNIEWLDEGMIDITFNIF